MIHLEIQTHVIGRGKWLTMYELINLIKILSNCSTLSEKARDSNTTKLIQGRNRVLNFWRWCNCVKITRMNSALPWSHGFYSTFLRTWHYHHLYVIFHLKIDPKSHKHYNFQQLVYSCQLLVYFLSAVYLQLAAVCLQLTAAYL